MNLTDNKTEIIKYETKGICCKLIHIEIQDNVIQNIEFFGGCDGNLKGIMALVKNMPIDEVIDKFSGISCGAKSTSCPDQLAACLKEYKSNK